MLDWVNANDNVDLLARLGVTLLLFVVGLKLDLHIFYSRDWQYRMQRASTNADDVSHSQELLVLFGIAWAVELATIGVWLGFSKEEGAFLAGVSLASTPYRDALGARLASLWDFLLLFLFIDLGARMDFLLLGAQLFDSLGKARSHGCQFCDGTLPRCRSRSESIDCRGRAFRLFHETMQLVWFIGVSRRSCTIADHI